MSKDGVLEPSKSKTRSKSVIRKWRNRIVGHAEVDPKILVHNPRNWRAHPDAQKEAITGILVDVGWVQSVIINKRTNCIVDGHARVALAITAKEKVPVVYVDLTDEEEARVLASFDTLSMMGVPEPGKLESLIFGMDLGSDPLDAFIGSIVDLGVKFGFQDATENRSPSDGRHRMGLDRDRDQQIKAVLFVKDLTVVERALRMVGDQNRGKALVEVCRAYIEQHPE